MSAAAVLFGPATRVSFRAHVLPWAVALDDELRFRHISRRILITCVLICLALFWLPVTKPDRTQVQQVALPMAKLLLDNVVKLPPPAPKPAAVAAPERKTAGVEPKAARNKEVPVPEARVPLPNKPPGELEAARRKVAGVGLLAMKDSLAELHGAPVAEQLKAVKPGLGVGSGVGVGVGAGTAQGLPSRAMITSNATGGSGGINTASYSRDTGGGGLAGRSTTLVEGVVGGGGGGGAGGGGARGRADGKGSGVGTAGAGGKAGGTLARDGSGKASRSLEDIRLVFERNKGAIYAIYNRALRADPGLQGKVVLKLTIAPSGTVVDCSIVSSELHQPELEGKLLARIRQFDFGAKDVNQFIVTWPIDLLPS
jgi:TonB family protein